MNLPESTAETDLRPFAERVVERAAGPCRLLTLQTPVREVVSFRGSFYSYPDFRTGEDLVQDLAVSLLDKGTRRRDRFALAEVLDNRGAQLQFYSSGLRVGFSGRALREHVPEVLGVVAEQLREPLFDAAEFEKAKAHMAAALRRALESTGAQASAALTRRLYGPGHPNYQPPPEEALARLAAFTREQVQTLHAQHFGPNELVLVLVGDIDGEAAAGIVEEQFRGWPPHEAPPQFEAAAAPQAPGRSAVPMADKLNVDVYMGHALRVRRQDEVYVPLYLANYVLGGNFSARLMTVIRDEMGLTYGIRSALSGIATEYDGHWQVGVTLSQEHVERGIEATLEEVRRFVAGGITEQELEEKKTTITGSFKVSLATTGGLATALLQNTERGFDPGYLDRFPAEVERLTLEQVNEAVRAHFKPGQFHFGLAGLMPETVPGGAEPEKGGS